MNFQKVNDFRSSPRYRPWGILVGVSVSYPTRAVAQLLGESRAYGRLEAPVKSDTLRDSRIAHVNSSLPTGQNGHNLTDDFFKCNLSNEKSCILIRTSLKFVQLTINNTSALVQVIAWCPTGAKELEPILTHFIVNAYIGQKSTFKVPEIGSNCSYKYSSIKRILWNWYTK